MLRGLCRLGAGGCRVGVLGVALESFWGEMLLPGCLGISKKPAHQLQPSKLPEAAASSSGAEVVVGEGRLQVLTLFSTKWHLWCNPRRLTWFSNLSVHLKLLSGLLPRQTPPPEMRAERVRSWRRPSVRETRGLGPQGHHCRNSAWMTQRLSLYTLGSGAVLRYTVPSREQIIQTLKEAQLLHLQNGKFELDPLRIIYNVKDSLTLAFQLGLSG